MQEVEIFHNYHFLHNFLLFSHFHSCMSLWIWTNKTSYIHLYLFPFWKPNWKWVYPFKWVFPFLYFSSTMSTHFLLFFFILKSEYTMSAHVNMCIIFATCLISIHKRNWKKKCLKTTSFYEKLMCVFFLYIFWYLWRVFSLIFYLLS